MKIELDGLVHSVGGRLFVLIDLIVFIIWIVGVFGLFGLL